MKRMTRWLSLLMTAVLLAALAAPGALAAENTVTISTAEELAALRPLVERWCALFGGDAEKLMEGPFTIVTPDSRNPYRQMYAAN